MVVLAIFALLATSALAFPLKRMAWTPQGFVAFDGTTWLLTKTIRPDAQLQERQRVRAEEARQAQQLRAQLKAQREEIKAYVQGGQCLMPCRTLPLPRETPPRLFAELCARRKLSPYTFRLIRPGELCCCP